MAVNSIVLCQAGINSMKYVFFVQGAGGKWQSGKWQVATCNSAICYFATLLLLPNRVNIIHKLDQIGHFEHAKIAAEEGPPSRAFAQV